MNTIQSQFSLTNTTSGITTQGSIRRDTVTDEFYLDALVITGPEDIDYGAITTPHRVTLKLVSGDELFVSFDAGTSQPLSLELEGEFLVLRINPADIPTIQLDSAGTSNIVISIEPL